MAEIIFQRNGCTSLGSIDSEEDLKPRPGFNINPPPSDGRCDCCGRHISKLKPFGGPGDPLVGDFSGAYLVKKFRPLAPYDEEAVAAMNEAVEKCKDPFDWMITKDGKEKGEDPFDWMITKYGKEKGEKLALMAEAYYTASASWECRECIILDSDEYFKKRQECRLTCDPNDYIYISEDELRPKEN